MDLDRDDLNQNEDEHDEPMPAFEGAEENSSLRHRQQSFQDELARTKAKLADMPRGWESRGVSGRDWDESSEGLTPQCAARRGRTPGRRRDAEPAALAGFGWASSSCSS